MTWSASRRIRVALAVLLGLLALGLAVRGQISARLTGAEVVLRAAAVDPVDAFRGAYVDLGYPDLPGQPGPEPTLSDPSARGPGFVPLRQVGDHWVGGPIQRTAPSSGIYLACNDADWRLRCGIESWFLPQDKAAALGERLRTGTVPVRVRIDSAGNAALVAVATP